MNTKEFLELLHGNDPINFRVIKGKNARNINGIYEKKTEQLLRQFNEQDYNIYFIVNGGGNRAKDINKINAVFIDFDCGRDKNKEYYPLEVIKKFKDECMKKVGDFKYKPSFIIETRNGIHVYWLLNEGTTIDEFLECQLRLIQYFDSDKAVKTPERLMRLPDYNWTKDINNQFLCSVIQSNKGRYEIKDIIEALPKIKDVEDKCTNDKNNNKVLVYIIGTSISESNNIALIKNQSLEMLQQIIQPQPILLNSHEEVYSYLKKQDLQLFLGLPKRFNCIFHKEKNPSANIYIHKETGYYWYKCFSQNCGVTKDIISITENLLKCSTPKALTFLRKLYKIDYVETEWQKERKQILDENVRLLLDVQRFELIAPETYKRIKNYIPDLVVINNFAKDKVITESFTDDKGIPLFYASIGFLGKMCSRRDVKSMCNRIGIFSYLGLVNKLDSKNIPEFLLRKSMEQAKMKKQKNIITYISIPSYCDEVLTFSENKAKEFKEKGFTMRGMSREMIYRALGEAEADRVYPQLKGKPLNEVSEEFACEVDKIAIDLILNQGYATEEQIVGYVKGNKEVTRSKLKRVIAETIDKYDFKKCKVNKKLKEKYGITVKGYPFIIIKNQNKEEENTNE